MHVGYVLVPVVELDSRSRELLRQLRDFVLKLRIVGQVAESRMSTAWVHLVVGPVFFVHVRVNYFADAVAEHSRHRDKDAERGKEDHNPGDADVALLVASGRVDLLRARAPIVRDS